MQPPIAISIVVLTLAVGAGQIAAQDLCRLGERLRAPAERTGRIRVPDVSVNGGAVGLRRSAVQLSAKLELYRVTSGFFTHDGRLGITNAGMQEVVLIGSNGEPVVRVGKQGAGPNEFVTLFFAHMRRDPERIVAYDFGARSMKEFTTNGHFVRSVNLESSLGYPVYDPRPIANGGFLALMTRSTGTATDRVANGLQITRVPIVSFDSMGRSIGVVAEVRGRDALLIGGHGGAGAHFTMPFGHEPWVGVDDAGCFVHPVEDGPGFVIRNPGGQQIVTITLPHVDTRITRGEWSEQLARLARSGHPYPDLRPPERKPAFSRGLFDGEKALWLEAYHMLNTPTRGWWVVDLAGRTSRFIPAPSNAYAIIAASSSRIAVVMHGEFNTERVVLFDVIQT